MPHPLHLTYFDTAMMLIEIGSLRLLTDPVLDRAGTVFEYGPVRLEKTSAQAVTPEALGRIDAVLLSHDQHGDNFDTAGRAFTETVPRTLTTPLAAERPRSARTTGLEPWQQAELTGADGFTLRITATPARHGPPGSEEATGPVTGFLLRPDNASSGGLYLSGDTVLFAGTDEIARRVKPVDVAVLHLGRVQLPALRAAQLTLSADDAAQYAEALGAKRLVPSHFEGWRHFVEPAAEAQAAFARSPVADRVQWLSRGVRTSFGMI